MPVPRGVPGDAGVERRRLSLLVRIAASAGAFSPHLADAVDRATDPEVRVLSDLVDRGMSIPEMVSVLQGAHVVVGDDDLYQRWIFPTSRLRMSSHHRSVDKRVSPDYGLDGPLVRESLHGRAVAGTWVQLERTRASFRWGRLPTWSDLVHIRDYIVYRVTGMNVGPWGLSAHVDTRPIVLRPPQAAPATSVARGLAARTRRRVARATTSSSDRAPWTSLLAPVTEIGPAGDLFRPPAPRLRVDLLPDAPYKDALGLGLFGSLPIVSARVALRPSAAALLESAPGTAGVAPPKGGEQSVRVALGARALRIGASTQRVGGRPSFLDVDQEDIA